MWGLQIEQQQQGRRLSLAHYNMAQASQRKQKKRVLVVVLPQAKQTQKLQRETASNFKITWFNFMVIAPLPATCRQPGPPPFPASPRITNLLQPVSHSERHTSRTKGSTIYFFIFAREMLGSRGKYIHERTIKQACMYTPLLKMNVRVMFGPLSPVYASLGWLSAP